MIKRNRHFVASFAAVCVLAGTLGGCGGGSDEAAAVARDFVEAQAARDGDAACALLTEEGIDEFVGTDSGDPTVESCVLHIDGLSGEGFEISEVSAVDETEGGAVIVHAETSLDPEPRVMVLVESNGEWLVDDPFYDSATEPEIE